MLLTLSSSATSSGTASSLRVSGCALVAGALAALLLAALLLTSIIILLSLSLALVGWRLLVAGLPSWNGVGVGIAGASRAGVVVIAAGA